jgi:short-subunit dehydrogenase
MTAAYCAAKHGVVALSSALRSEARALGVKVSVVCPGTVDTGLFESIEYIRTDKELIQASIRRVLLPADRCARAILRGVASNRSIIPITLHARLTWWLYRLMPRTFLAITAFFFQGVRSRLRTAEPQASKRQKKQK